MFRIFEITNNIVEKKNIGSANGREDFLKILTLSIMINIVLI